MLYLQLQILQTNGCIITYATYSRYPPIMPKSQWAGKHLLPYYQHPHSVIMEIKKNRHANQSVRTADALSLP